MSSTFFLYEFNQQNYFTSKTFFSVFIYISLFLTSFCKPANPTSSVFSVSLFSLTTTTFPDGMLYHQACTTGPFFSQKNYYFKAWPVRAKVCNRQDQSKFRFLPLFFANLFFRIQSHIKFPPNFFLELIYISLNFHIRQISFLHEKLYHQACNPKVITFILLGWGPKTRP